MNDVSLEIRKTLSEEPELFWLYNNGITILVDEVMLLTNKKNRIKFGGTVSVVNGAQTISSAARYFFDGKENEIDIKKAKVAKVLLRIIRTNEGREDAEDQSENDSKSKNKLIEMRRNITVNLNRQKPINIDDIAYVTENVRAINDIYEEFKDSYENVVFRIVKKGEERAKGNMAYSLIDVARLIIAVNGYPGNARSAATKTIIKISEQKINSYKNQSIKFFNELIDQELSIEQDERFKLFKNNYGYVNLGIRLLELFENLRGENKKTDQYKNIYSYGKYHIVGYLIKYLREEYFNRGEGYDYKKCEDLSDEAEIKTLLEDLIKKLSDIEDVKQATDTIKMNRLNNEIGQAFIEKIKEDTELINKIKNSLIIELL